LAVDGGALACRGCGIVCPIVDGIPDLMAPDPTLDDHPVSRGVRWTDWLAPIYESRVWYPFVLNLYGGWRCTTLEHLVEAIGSILGTAEGLILDAACGPGTFGRRVVGATRQAYGVDLSMGMLRQGMAYAERDRQTNVHFARARVEALPFEDGLFDAAICCGSLHLFAETVRALREIGRAMKAGAPLAVMTFCAGDSGLLRFSRIRRHVRRDHGARIFELPELERYLTEAGFGQFQPQTYGSVLVFGAQKRTGSRASPCI
jgi:ubiquinone/menaquinone biosynthesis C-methylase UbiE